MLDVRCQILVDLVVFMKRNIVEAKMDSLGLRKVNILGVRVAVADMERVLEIIKEKCEMRNEKRVINRPFLVVTVNSEFVMQAQEDEEFKKILNQAGLALADGVGLKLVDGSLEIVAGRRLVEGLVGNQSKSEYKIFYLGGGNSVAQKMAEKYGGMADPGHKDIRSGMLDVRENARIIEKINGYGPDLLLVAYGAPWQEKWLWRNRDRIKAGVVMGVGGAFDYLVGRAKLPPEWVSNVGMEWLWRLLHEPWRWRRQLRLVKFAWMAVISHARGV
jgi:N-acetylglucosaminyldiphosphoundecaprenol N-acetyl-beta-D-mannosaminyltransferase